MRRIALTIALAIDRRCISDYLNRPVFNHRHFKKPMTRRFLSSPAILSILCVLIGLAVAGPAKAATKTVQAPEVFQDCPQCPEMVVVPKGVFIMGSDLLPAEQPKHPVFFKKPFALSRFEITFDEWEACLADGGCTHNPHDHNWGRGRQPVVNIDFSMAEGYARWLSKKTGHTYRLPSEAEWEYAARAGTKAASARATAEDMTVLPTSGTHQMPLRSYEPMHVVYPTTRKFSVSH